MKQFMLLITALLLVATVSVTTAFDFSFWYQRNGVEAVKSIKNISVGGVQQDQKDNFLDVVKGVANWVFGILALIALLIVMYWGFLMVTSTGEDDGYTKWLSIMKSALIGIALIGVAWFVVSIIIWLAQQTWRAAEWSTANTNQ